MIKGKGKGKGKGKRVFDIVVSSGAIVALSPVIAGVAALVRLKLGSPVIFRQERPGLDADIFEVYKFRTMTGACDESGVLLPDSSRLTGFGSWLRSSSLDELPELVNVLKGEMSLVGPRPLLPRYTNYFTEAEARRFDVRPGITGWAQVNGRNSVSWDDRLAMDLWYVENASVGLDFRIILSTVRNVIMRSDVAPVPRLEMRDLDEERQGDSKR